MLINGKNVNYLKINIDTKIECMYYVIFMFIK